MINHRETAKKLLETATHPNTPEGERVAATVKVLKLIKEHDLLSSPLDALIGVAANNETVRAATTVFSHLTSTEFVDSMKTVARAFGRKPAAGGGSGGGSRRTSRRR